MDEICGRVLTVIECKNPSCDHKITRQGYPDEWPDEGDSEDRIHSDWNESLTPFCVKCVKCGHFTGNKIERSKKWLTRVTGREPRAFPYFYLFTLTHGCKEFGVPEPVIWKWKHIIISITSHEVKKRREKSEQWETWWKQRAAARRDKIDIPFDFFLYAGYPDFIQ